ncbi:hypothetical protein GCM10023075_28180 [Streptosporangium album]
MAVMVVMAASAHFVPASVTVMPNHAGPVRMVPPIALSRMSPVAVDQLMNGFRTTYAVLCAIALCGTVSAVPARPRRIPAAGDSQAGATREPFLPPEHPKGLGPAHMLVDRDPEDGE